MRISDILDGGLKQERKMIENTQELETRIEQATVY